jgi:hypothetical protein
LLFLLRRNQKNTPARLAPNRTPTPTPTPIPIHILPVVPRLEPVEVELESGVEEEVEEGGKTMW